jgi:hypothetical protein
MNPIGYMHNPFDTIIGEARLCDVQIPYHNGFKLLYKTNNYATWFDYGWKPLPSNTLLPSSDLFSPELQLEEDSAVITFYHPVHLWQGWPAQDTFMNAILAFSGDSAILNLTGPSVISCLKLIPDSYDTSLDSVWIEMYWDGSLSPDFSAPLLALFGQSYDFRPLHSLPIDFSQDSGFEMRFPMPFQSGARIVLTNRSHKPHEIALTVRHSSYPVDRSSLGYLHAFFSEIQATKFHVPHHVLHRKGRCRYVGLLMGIPNRQYVTTMEGDALFSIDSDAAYTFHYEGTEDYFNGAQYFSNGNFLTPFGGTSNILANFYRFHYFDAYDARKSFDFDFQHGNETDCREHYRTLAFWYEKQIPFWTDHDTIRNGETWRISGGGLQSKEQISLKLGDQEVDNFSASDDGSFTRSIVVPAMPPGFYTLTMNGIAYPEAIFVSASPTLQLLGEPKPLARQAGDTLWTGGEGYVQNDALTATIHGITAFAKLSVDSTHHLSGWIIVPKLPDGNFAVQVHGAQSGDATSGESIQNSSTLTFECESLDFSPKTIDGGFLNLCGYAEGYCSEDAVFSFRPNSNERNLNLQFEVSLVDTFKTTIYLLYGRTFGNYDILIDGIKVTQYDGYLDTVLERPDSVSLGEQFLQQGRHILTAQYTGHDPQATDSLIWADNIKLIPILPVNRIDTAPIPSSPLSLHSEQNPTTTNITLIATGDGVAKLTLSDILGRPVFSTDIMLSQSSPLHFDIPITLIAGTYYARLVDSSGESREVAIVKIY